MAEEASKHAAGTNPLALELERAGLALSAARMGEFEWRSDTDEMIVSERMAKITGLPAGPNPAASIRGMFRNVHPDDLQSLRQAMKEGLAEAQRFEAQYRVVDPKTGGTRWLYSAGVGLTDAAGVRRVVGLV